MRKCILPCLGVMVLCSCVSYRQREVPFRPPSAFSNMQVVAGAELAALAYEDASEAKVAFGFNIRKAGLLPVQVIIDNQGASGFEFVPEQTFLIDVAGSYWNLLDRRTAYERIEKSSEYARIAKGAGEKSVLGAAGGALVGAAVGILTGSNVVASAGTGAAVGAAGGAVIGGGAELSGYDAQRAISRDLATKELKNLEIKPGTLANGFLFFPGEAPSADKLRLQLRDTASGEIQTLIFDLTSP